MTFNPANVKMVQLKSETYKSKEFVRVALQNTMMLYTKTVPSLKMKKKGDRDRFFKDREYAAEAIINKTIAKELKKLFTGKVIINRVDNEDFEEKYKIPAPSDDDEFYILKLTRHASYPEGEWNEFQHTLQVGKLEGRTVVKYPMKKVDSKAGKEFSGLIPDILIGNGTVGDMIIKAHFYKDTDNNREESKPIPTMIVIRELVEVQSNGGAASSIKEDEMDDLGYEGFADYEGEGQGHDINTDDDDAGNSPSGSDNDDDDDDDDWETE